MGHRAGRRGRPPSARRPELNAAAATSLADDRRRAVLTAAVGFARLAPQARSFVLLHRWLDTWGAIGDIEVGMERQGFDLQLTKYDGRGWRATFYVTGMEHSPTGATGTAWEPTAWRAVQQAALRQASRDG